MRMQYYAVTTDRCIEHHYIPARVMYLNSNIGSAKTRTLTDVKLYPDSPQRLKEILGGNLERSDCSKIKEKSIDEVLALVIYPTVECMEEGLKREDYSIALDKIDARMKIELGL
jgi:hypothetical protein